MGIFSEPIGGVAWNLARRCILTTFRTDKILVSVCWFFTFWHHFSLWNWSNLRFLGIFLIMHVESGLKLGMTMYHDHLHLVTVSWFYSFRHHFDFMKVAKSELIKFWSQSADFPLLASLWLHWSNLRFPGIFWEPIRGVAWNSACWLILTTFRTD